MKQTVGPLRRGRLERVVFLVDVKVLLAQEDPRNCAAQIFSSVVALLGKCNDQSKFSTLWGYVFFDSSRSPVASSAAVGRLVAGVPPRERFDGTSQNLEKFGKVLETLVASGNDYTPNGESRADCIARTMATIASDFPWGPLVGSDSSSSDEEMRSTCQSGTYYDLELQYSKPESNLLFMFSSLPTCSTELAGFLDFNAELAGFSSEKELLHEFSSRFGSVHSLLDSKRIGCCWIDVPTTKGNFCSEPYKSYVDFAAELSVTQRCLFARGWNFASLSLVANIEKSIPLSLIWNSIAHLTPELLELRAVARCDARVHCRISGQCGDSKGLTIFSSLEVRRCGKNILPSSRSGLVSRISWLLAEEDLDVSSSRRLEIIISAILPRKTNIRLSSERFLLLPKATPFCTEAERQQLANQRSKELKDSLPSWHSLLISLESEGSVAFVAVGGRGCNFQAILEPFTPNSALLSILDNVGSPLGRKHVPTRLSCHLSRVSKRSLKEKLDEYARGKGRWQTVPDNSNVGEAGVESSDVNEFEKSFDSALVKVVKEKRRGCVLFKSVKKNRVELGKKLDPTHELFQGNSSEPENISWTEFWLRSVKHLQRKRTLPCWNFTFSSTVGSITCPDDFPNVEQPLESPVLAPATEVSLGIQESRTDLLQVRPDRECATQRAVEDSPAKLCISIPSTPPEVRGDLELDQTASDWPSFSASPHTFGSTSPDNGDGAAAEIGVPLLPIPDITSSYKAVSNKETCLDPRSFGTLFEVGFGNNSACEHSFLERLVQEVLISGETDLHQFSKLVVRNAYREALHLKDEGVAEEGMLAREVSLCPASNPVITARLKKMLLKKPKHLMSKYKERLASEASSTRSRASILAEKFREHELQILFRLEILTQQGDCQNKGTEGCFTGDICQLLDNIQFNLPDGEGNEQTLQQYCDRVIVSRYRCSLPSTIREIYSAMELNGYCDPTASFSSLLQGVQISVTQPSSENMVPQSEDEPAEPLSYAEGDSLGQQEVFLPANLLPNEADSNRGDVISSSPRNSSGKENWAANSAVRDIPDKLERKRQKKVYHFSSGAHNLLRVKAIKPRDPVVTKPHGHACQEERSVLSSKVSD
ncbi:hypothetical protein R1flu_005347 [Riccia fluitans]|uniref:Treslin n=1 Tax=Riccia fluitans TaxID=41844 RepID=A0ABD1YT60_9MARC